MWGNINPNNDFSFERSKSSSFIWPRHMEPGLFTRSLASLYYLKKDGEVEVPGRHDKMQDLCTSKFIFLENGTLILEH